MCNSIKMYKQTLIFNKEDLDESMVDYNPLHFTLVDFDYLHLVNNNLHNTNDDYKHICGIIISLISIFYLIYNSCIAIVRK